MEPKNRLFIVIAVTVLIVGAMFTSFGRNLFTLNTPEVVLPGPTASTSAPAPSAGQLYQPVEVTPQTVSSVVATLARPDSYYRELTVESFWTGGQTAFQVQAWTDRGWSYSRQVRPSGAIRHDLVGDGHVYYWYDGSQQYRTAPADQLSQDLAQHIPTYETVVELDASRITAAGYELRGELPCVYAQVEDPDSGYIQRYWVSVDSGLLVGAEMLEQDQVVYRMSALSPVQTPCPADAQFTLPDGTVMHTVGAAEDGAA